MQGERVRIGRLRTTTGMVVHSAYVEARKEGAVGTVVQIVPGHGGDVWLVEHDDDHARAVYCVTEMDPFESEADLWQAEHRALTPHPDLWAVYQHMCGGEPQLFTFESTEARDAWLRGWEHREALSNRRGPPPGNVWPWSKAPDDVQTTILNELHAKLTATTREARG